MYFPYLSLASIQAFSSAYTQSDFFGKLIFLGLFLLSAICWVVLFQKIVLVRKTRGEAAKFTAVFQQQKGHLLSLEAHDIAGDAASPFAHLFFSLKEKSLEILNKNHYFIAQAGEKEKSQVFLSQADLELVESYALTEISRQVKALEKNIFILSTIVTLAPFLGLLGTVWGILMTFSGLHSGAAVSSNSAVLGGLSTALATTVLGLLIAIPALVSYNYIKNSLRILTSDMEDFLYSLLSILEMQYRKVDL